MRRCVLFLALALSAWGAAAGEPVRVSTPYPLSRDVAPGDDYMGLTLLGTLKLEPVEVNGNVLAGLSGLAWDADEGTFYALSDRAIVFHMQIDFDDAELLREARVSAAYRLQDARGRALTGRRGDSEGLALINAANGVRGDTELAICFERLPRVLRFTPEGGLKGAVALPARLRDRRNYRTGNRGLESLALHPRHGLITAVEQPFAGVSDGTVEMHALGSGRYWLYPLAAEPNAALTDAVALPDGSLLTLERGYGVFFVPFITTVRRVRVLPQADGALLAPETVARFNTGQGWSLDNFEGIALQGPDRILMVSDDNSRVLQSTLLAAFRLRDTDGSSKSARTMKAVKDPAAKSAIQ